LAKVISTKVLVMFGSIDSYVKGTIKENLRVEPNDFRSNLEKMIRAVVNSISHAYVENAKELPSTTLKANEFSVEVFCIAPIAPNETLMKRNWMSTFDVSSYKREYQFRNIETTKIY